MRLEKIIYFPGLFALLFLLVLGCNSKRPDNYSTSPTYRSAFNASMFSQENYVGCIQGAFSNAEIPIKLYAEIMP